MRCGSRSGSPLAPISPGSPVHCRRAGGASDTTPVTGDGEGAAPGWVGRGTTRTFGNGVAVGAAAIVTFVTSVIWTMPAGGGTTIGGGGAWPAGATTIEVAANW